MSFVKRSFLSAVRKMGYDIHRLDPGRAPQYQLHLSLERFGIDLVLDVGSNDGEFGKNIRSYGYRGLLVSFEPLSGPHAALTRSAASDARWLVHPRTAIGDRDGEIDIHVAGNSVSSSILPMLDAHSSAAPASTYVSVEHVPVSRLDSVAPSYLAKATRPFLKIDTQGFEGRVLDGAAAILPQLQGVMCELSVVPLYEGQPMWEEMLSRLSSAGFTLWALQPAFSDPRDGRTLQLDAIWFRT